MSDQSRVVDPPHGLVEGQRLDQPTFHALYEAMPPSTRAELINGVVRLDPTALLAGDFRRLHAVVELGCATPEHMAFVARLAAARSSPQR